MYIFLHGIKGICTVVYLKRTYVENAMGSAKTLFKTNCWYIFENTQCYTDLSVYIIIKNNTTDLTPNRNPR